MKVSLDQDDLQPTPDSFGDRCRDLGLPTWRFDARGVITAEPTGWGQADPWLRAPLLKDWISKIVNDMMRGVKPEIIGLFPGCWLVPIAESGVPPDRGLTVALALSDEVLRCEKFLTICRSVQLDADSARRAISRLARFRRSELDRLAGSLRWMHDDLLRADDRDSALSDLSEQLVNAYEQITHLYQLGRSMNWLTKPQEFLKVTCDLLWGTLDFAWIVVRCSSSEAVPPEMAATMTIAGTIPCSLQKFDTLVATLLSQTLTDQWTTQLEPTDNELAAAVGSQLVANPVMAGDRVAGLLLAGNKAASEAEITSIDTQLIGATADYLGAFLHNVAMNAEQQEMFLGTIQALAAAIDAKDRYTRGHSERVAMLSSQLAQASGMDTSQIERVRIAGLVHDVGKIGVPEAVLRKAGKLTDDEYEQIKRHPTVGYHILKDIKPLEDVLPGVLYHHEWWNGHGYPEGLRGENIPLFGRLLAVADAFDAMSSDRSYRPAIPRDQVLREIADCAGTQFDPELAKIFVTLDLSKYDRMVDRHGARESRAA